MLLGIFRERLLKDIKKIIAAQTGSRKAKTVSLKKADQGANLSSITVSEPKNKSFGDISTNAAMVLAPVLKENPMKIAEAIKKDIISKWAEVEEASIASPGFINLNLDRGFLCRALESIARETKSYGKNNTGRQAKIQIEFVSANPTGSLHIGHGRWAALGDSLSNIYEANGYSVWREYYVNDYGSQIDKFAECIASIYMKNFNIEAPYPDDGYPEETVKTVVADIIKQHGSKYILGNSGKADVQELGRAGVGIMLERITGTLISMGVEFDEWFYESTLYGGSNFEDTIKELEKKGIVYGKDNALWFKTSAYGDDKDRVVVRSRGEPTYFASDIMYFLNKAGRGFERLIYILGADHHGYVKRLKAIGKATGFDEGNIDIIIGQLVRLVKKGQVVRMSKREGKFYSLADLIEEVGSDAVRFFFSASSFDTPMDFDIGLAKQKSSQNPVYYVQYAHARISSIFEKIKEMHKSGQLQAGSSESGVDILMESTGFDETCEKLAENMDFKNIELEGPEDASLAKALLLYPDTVFDACENNAPYLVNQYLYRIASEFHYFYNHCRIIDNSKLSESRFKLTLLTRIVLKNALDILNISAPLKM